MKRHASTFLAAAVLLAACGSSEPVEIGLDASNTSSTATLPPTTTATTREPPTTTATTTEPPTTTTTTVPSEVTELIVAQQQTYELVQPSIWEHLGATDGRVVAFVTRTDELVAATIIFEVASVRFDLLEIIDQMG